MTDPKLSVSSRAALAKNTKIFPADTMIFEEGDTTRDLYLLLRGRVVVIKAGQKIAEISEPMSYFGEMSAILGEPRSAAIKALEESEFMIVPGDKFESLIDVSPAVGKKILQTLAQRLSSMNEDRKRVFNEARTARQRSQEQVSSAAQDYKRLLYAIALVYEGFKLPQVAELLKYGKESSTLANHAVRLDLDERHFVSSPFVHKLHKAKQS